ncbi:MAG: DegV family protein, partial [Lachnospiraceae bacterium]|nr:DegV family protein [Lachnospiraceae bacterium]
MIQVCSDSTADLSRELAERYHIHIIPLHVVLGDQEYRDSVDITPQEIFRWSDTHQSTPKTSAPGFYETLDFFKKILDAGDEIIAMSISSEISTSYNVMCLAAKELKAEDRISVIDSRNLSTGIAHLLLSACDIANAVWAREDIVREVRRMIPRVRTSFVVNTLVYLARGGRCNAVTAMLGGMLQLHPRINVTDGVMTTGRS